MRRFEVVRGSGDAVEVLAHGVEFAAAGGVAPCVVQDTGSPMPVTYGRAGDVPLAYPGGSVRWLDPESGG